MTGISINRRLLGLCGALVGRESHVRSGFNILQVARARSQQWQRRECKRDVHDKWGAKSPKGTDPILFSHARLKFNCL